MVFAFFLIYATKNLPYLIKSLGQEEILWEIGSSFSSSVRVLFSFTLTTLSAWQIFVRLSRSVSIPLQSGCPGGVQSLSCYKYIHTHTYKRNKYNDNGCTRVIVL